MQLEILEGMTVSEYSMIVLEGKTVSEYMIVYHKHVNYNVQCGIGGDKLVIVPVSERRVKSSGNRP